MDDDELTKTNKVSREDAAQEETIRTPEVEPTPSLIVLSGMQLGKLFHIPAGKTTLGRGMDADIVLYDSGISRKHAQVLRQPDGTILFEDLHSTNGSYIEDKAVKRAILQNGDRIRLGVKTLLKFSLHDTIEEQFLAQLYETVTQDPLTSLYNKRALFEHLTREIAWHKRHQKPLTLAMLDIDNFKDINDKYGHIIGDKLLIHLSSLLKKTSRAEDFIARFGGDEFVCVLRDTSLAHGALFARRIAQSAQMHPLRTEADTRSPSMEVPTSLSIGLASLKGVDLTDGPSLLSKADTCLYEAKKKGKNQICY